MRHATNLNASRNTLREMVLVYGVYSKYSIDSTCTEPQASVLERGSSRNSLQTTRLTWDSFAKEPINTYSNVTAMFSATETRLDKKNELRDSFIFVTCMTCAYVTQRARVCDMAHLYV